MENTTYREELKSYITGFALSIFFTIIAFSAVMLNLLQDTQLILALIVLAIFQAATQLVFFLHLKPWARNRENPAEQQEANWNLAILTATIGIILIVVVGALWIMNHLNYNMTPDFMNSQMIKMEGMK